MISRRRADVHLRLHGRRRLVGVLPTWSAPLLLVSALVAPAALAADTMASASAVLQTVADERILDGRVEAVNRSTVSAQTSGRVVGLPVDVDDFVTAGTVILRLSGIEQRAGAVQAEARVADARARLAEAAKGFDRAGRLLAENAISRAAYEQDETRLETARAGLQSAEAALVRAREEAGYTVVRAPYDGVVTARHVELGETVSPGQPLLSGFSLDELRVRVEVPQRLIHAVRAKRRARILSAHSPAIVVESSALTIFPHASAESHTVAVWVALPPGVEGFFPGMLVKVALMIGERERLIVPEQAIVYRSEVVGVYTVSENGAVSLRHIRTGHRTDDGMVEVLAGLDAGERVALDPSRALMQLKRAQGR